MAISMPEEKSGGGKRKALGRGLDSLLPKASGPPAQQQPSSGEVERNEEDRRESGRALELALDLIERNPFQTRERFDEALLEELANSIRAVGVLQPVLVRPLGDGRYQLVTGERRWLASGKAGLATLPAVVTAMSDAQAMEATIVENLQRADLNPMEQARAFDRLGREFRMTQEQMAVRTGKDRASISNFLRLLRLPKELQGLVETGSLTFGHARALLALESPEQMGRAAQKMQALAMSVRQAETFVKGILDPERRAPQEDVRKAGERKDANVREMEDRLRKRLGLRVTIKDRNGRGQVVIEYADLEGFDGLVEALLGL